MNLIVPEDVQRKAGIRAGDKIEFKASRHKITIVATPSEESPSTRRRIDARIAKAQQGPYHGPFETVDEALTYLKKEVRKRRRSRAKAR